MFQDRRDAGQQLAEQLAKFAGSQPVLLAIPRGGVEIAAEVAVKLKAKIDLVFPRKIGSPGNPELAVGAVAASGQVIVNKQLQAQLGISDKDIDYLADKELREIERRRKLYLGERQVISLKGKTAIIIDDGLATGYTAKAAVLATKARQPQSVVLAVPVAPVETVESMKSEVDELICLSMVKEFYAIGQFYYNFSQVSDSQVISIIEKYGIKRSK
jgi:predicted phosphoribosyltransferase